MNQSTNKAVLDLGDRKVVGWALNGSASTATAAAPANDPKPVLPDVDPRYLMVEGREDGSWPSQNVKATLPGPDGTIKLYFNLGFGLVCGRKDGEDICIERPLEIFMPASTSTVDQQWISSHMRMLSLIARAGLLSKALSDMRQVTAAATVWYGKDRNGKTKIHSSVVACFAWLVQEELRKRGYFDDDYKERSIEDIASGSKALAAPQVKVAETPVTAETPTPEGKFTRCTQPGCGAAMVLQSGCLTCTSCGHSKCG